MKVLITEDFQIVVPDEATRTEQFAAEELQRYAEMMTGTKLPIVRDTYGANSQTIQVGQTKRNQKLDYKFDPSVTGTGADTYMIDSKTLSSHVSLIGGSDRGTLYSVYRFLEFQGCRFFAPDPLYEVVPKKEQLSLIKSRFVDTPYFVQREIDGSLPDGMDADQFIDWHAKQRLNRVFGFREYHVRRAYPDQPEKRYAWQKRGGYFKWQWICHNLFFMFPAEENHFQKHPDYFSLYKGERIQLGSSSGHGYGGGNLCTTNPDVIEHCAQFAIDWFDKYPNGSVVPIWPADGSVKWCECENCRALGGVNFMAGPEGSMSRRWVTFTNAIAKIVAQKHPDRLLLLPAYANYIEPVPDIKLEPNIFVQYCYHGIYSRGPQALEENKKAVDQMRAWAKQATGPLGVWEYFLIGSHTAKGNVPVHLPLVYRAHETMQFLREIYVTYYFTQSSAAYRKYNPLMFYALARLCWDPTLEPDAIIEDYCEHLFGQAAKPMTQYYKLFETAVRASTWKPKFYSDVMTPSPRVYTPEVLAEADRLLASALSVATDAKVKLRLADVQKVHDYTRANVRTQNVAGLDENVPWRLDRGEDRYVMNADGKSADPEYFDQLLRNAQDMGHDSPTFRRTIFRAQKRVLPVQTISNDAIKVAVLPEIGGRIIRIVDRRSGWNFLCEKPGEDTLENIGETYFNYGGYEEYIGPAFAGPGWEMPFTSDVSADSAGERVELQSQTDTFHLKRVVQLPPGDQPIVFVTSTLTNTTGLDQRIKLRVHPQFELGNNPASCAVQMLKPDGSMHHTTAGSEHDGSAVQPHGVWAVHDQKTDRAVINYFDPEQAGVYFFVNDEGGYFNMELMGKFKTLKPGESLTIAHAYRVLSNAAAQLQALLLAAPEKPAPSQAVKPMNDRVDFVDGKVGQAASFNDGSLLSYDSIYAKGNAGTMSMWVKLPTDASDTKQLHLFGIGANDPGWFSIAVHEGQLNALMKFGRSPYHDPDEFYNNLPADVSQWKKDQWHHLAVTWGNIGKGKSMLQIYIDGKLKAERYNITIGESFAGDVVAIGRSSASSKHRSTCAIDELHIQNRPLTDSEIAASYAASLAGRPTQATKNTLLLLSFDESADGVSITKSALIPPAVKEATKAITQTLTTQPAK